MKVALCCIERLENLYIREFVEYYKNIGIDHIFMYDTNKEYEDHIEDVINDYIDDGFVEKIEWKLELPRKEVLLAYTDICNRILKNSEYDWCCFFDPDEYLVLVNHKNIKEYLEQQCFKNTNIIGINWLNMDDNNLFFYDNRPLNERFTRPFIRNYNSNICNWTENHHIKSIIHKSYFMNIKWNSPHFPIIFNDTIVKNADGNNIYFNINSKTNCKSKTSYYDNAYLKHFRCKTMHEYIFNKLPKLTLYGYNSIKFDKDFFFKYNHKTDVKEYLFDEIYNEFKKTNKLT